ncbi:MAG: transporter [Verrucomicrobiales bacterium]|nr:transporter [Verrucomicrobiales bacterium]
MKTLNQKLAVVLTGLTMLTGTLPSHADERFFTYIYDADVIPQGRWEFEQWLTYRKGYDGDNHDYDRYIWDFREEMEYGLTEKLSGSLYLNFRQEQMVAQQAGLSDSSEFSFKGVSAEFKYQLLNPNTKPVGVALYFEPTYNGNEQELEYKLIVSKNIGDHWVLAANAAFEQEWEQEDAATKMESVLEFTAGAAYRFTPNWSGGIEGRYHSVYEGTTLNEHLGTGWFLGPNIHYGTDKWWATLTVLPQIAGNPTDDGINLTEHQIFETRLIFGISF